MFLGFIILKFRVVEIYPLESYLEKEKSMSDWNYMLQFCYFLTVACFDPLFYD